MMSVPPRGAMPPTLRAGLFGPADCWPTAVRLTQASKAALQTAGRRHDMMDGDEPVPVRRHGLGKRHVVVPAGVVHRHIAGRSAFAASATAASTTAASTLERSVKLQQEARWP